MQTILDEIEDEIRQIMFEDCRDGANDYAYVRVYPDGEVVSGRDASWSCHMSEYYGESPHPLTVWSASGFRESQTGENGVFCWEEVEIPLLDGEIIDTETGGIYNLGVKTDDVENRMGRHCWYYEGVWYTTDEENLAEDFDLREIMSEIEESLEEWAHKNLRIGVDK